VGTGDRVPTPIKTKAGGTSLGFSIARTVVCHACKRTDEETSQVEGRSPLIAIVEDDASMLRSIQRLLAIEGVSVEAYESAEAFLDRRSTNQVDCLVLDIQLPKMSGLELRQQLTTMGSDIPVIFITAIEDKSVENAATRLGCVAYLRKPFPPEMLIAAVRDALASFT
jgi:FixJ family two-component response regulator